MNWKDKNILITGVGGFAGSYLAEELLNQKANVYGLIRRRADGTKAKNLIDHGIENNVKTIEGDLTEITSLANSLEMIRTRLYIPPSCTVLRTEVL